MSIYILGGSVLEGVRSGGGRNAGWGDRGRDWSGDVEGRGEREEERKGRRERERKREVAVMRDGESMRLTRELLAERVHSSVFTQA